MGNHEPNEADKLVEFAGSRLDFGKLIESHSRGGEYTLLFLKSEDNHAGSDQLLWANAWLASEEHVQEIEASMDHLQGRYIQQGFHPGYGTKTEGSYYEPIYGGPLEPLALGWSADDRRIEPELSQEFERCYKLARVEDNRKTVWNSWQESVDEVAILERHRHGTVTLTARTDFVKDFQYLRKRWLLIGVYGEWGNRTASGPHVFATRHVPYEHKLYLFGVPSESAYEYVEVQGYFLFRMPLEEQFSAAFGFGVPAGVRASAERLEFQTSQGRIKPWDILQGNRWDSQSSATAMFDQEVLRRYQSEPGAEVSLDNIGQLQIRSRKVHLWRMAMLLGTEYLSIWMHDFIEGVPPSEWPHWNSFNLPFIGFDRQKELFEAKNLFRLTADLIRQTRAINNRWLRLSGDDGIPFNLRHNTQKDFQALTKALPRHPDAHELIDRGKALDGLIIERIAATPMRTFLKEIGFATAAIEGLAGIKLFSTFMMVVRIAEAVEEWQDNFQAALSYAQKKVAAWQRGATEELAPEESKVVEGIAGEFEVMFLVHDLRVLAAHAAASELESEIIRAFKKRLGGEIDQNQFRGPILWLYNALSKCLEKCGD